MRLCRITSDDRQDLIAERKRQRRHPDVRCFQQPESNLRLMSLKRHVLRHMFFFCETKSGLKWDTFRTHGTVFSEIITLEVEI